MRKKVLVVNGASYSKALGDLIEATSRVSHFMARPQDFSLVLFTGGEDISPFLYQDESPKGYCQINPARDLFEQEIFEMALKHNVLMTGICRGVQFLNVMAGGRMMHHLSGHAGQQHDMTTLCGDIIHVNSLHHQMVLPAPDAIVAGWATHKRSNYYIGTGDEDVKYDGKENEFIIFPKIKAFGVQYHPEMMIETSSGYMYYYNMVRMALDSEWKDFIEHYSGDKHVKTSA